VPHERLLAKCRGQVAGVEVTGVLNGEASEWADVLPVVPHGSVLGPTLFLIFINDIDRVVDVTSSVLLKFANDTKVGRVVENEEQREGIPVYH
jgi:ribonuclease P/MRP protein subunit RPP40